MAKLEIIAKNSTEDIQEYRKETERTINIDCPGCGNCTAFTIYGANERIPCKRCRG